MWLRLIMILTYLFISTASFAQGTDQHVLGTIMAIDATHLEIKTTKGQLVTVRLNKQTRHKDESNPKGANMPAVGDRVVVKATKSEKRRQYDGRHRSPFFFNQARTDPPAAGSGSRA